MGTPLLALGPVGTPGTIPRTVNPPRTPEEVAAAPSITASVQRQAPAPAASQNLVAKVHPPANARADARAPQTAALVAKPVQLAKPHPAVRLVPPTVAAETPAKSSGDTSDQRTSNTASLTPSTAPMAPAGNFESRWSAITGRGRF